MIDLTKDSESSEKELQAAIAESLRDQPGNNILGGQVSKEEQDISRVLEQSLQEQKSGEKRKRTDIWFVDPLNPHDRKREDQWPVGMKNVGNTCWFSCVIQVIEILLLSTRIAHYILFDIFVCLQSLYYLPVFRKLVLNFDTASQMLLTESTDTVITRPLLSLILHHETYASILFQTRNINFMRELRRIFALLIASKRKYIDPTKAVDILKEAFTS